MRRPDVRIVGPAVAGLSAARVLTPSSRRVTLVEPGCLPAVERTAPHAAGRERAAGLLQWDQRG